MNSAPVASGFSAYVASGFSRMGSLLCTGLVVILSATLAGADNARQIVADPDVRRRCGGSDKGAHAEGRDGFFRSPSASSDEYLLYVVQLERQSGEWVFIGGYAGEVVTRRGPLPTFAPDRGLTRAIVWRASYAIDTNRRVALEGAVRQTAAGAFLKAEYSQAYGQQWRVTVTSALIRGDADDFLGAYRRNSHLVAALRYSF